MTPQQITVLVLGALALVLIGIVALCSAAADREQARRDRHTWNEIRALDGLPPLPERF